MRGGHDADCSVALGMTARVTRAAPAVSDEGNFTAAWATGCDTPDEGRQAVRALKKAGVDQIKVYALLKHDVYRAIANEATSVGLPVVGHIPDSITLKEAMQAGQQSVEHLTRMETLFDGVVPLGARPTTKDAFAGGFWANYERVSDDNKKRLFAELKSSGLRRGGLQVDSSQR